MGGKHCVRNPKKLVSHPMATRAWPFARLGAPSARRPAASRFRGRRWATPGPPWTPVRSGQESRQRLSRCRPVSVPGRGARPRTAPRSSERGLSAGVSVVRCHAMPAHRLRPRALPGEGTPAAYLSAAHRKAKLKYNKSYTPGTGESKIGRYRASLRRQPCVAHTSKA
jgi:hypothetical protein